MYLIHITITNYICTQWVYYTVKSRQILITQNIDYSPYIPFMEMGNNNRKYLYYFTHREQNHFIIYGHTHHNIQQLGNAIENKMYTN